MMFENLFTIVLKDKKQLTVIRLKIIQNLGFAVLLLY